MKMKNYAFFFAREIGYTFLWHRGHLEIVKDMAKDFASHSSS